MASPGEITQLLRQADDGNADADQRLYLLVEQDLRAIARKRKQAHAKSDMPTTQLIDDAFLGLVGAGATTWSPGDRRKFFGYMSRKMHDQLIEAARRARAQKRGGEARREVDEAAWDGSPPDDCDTLLDLKEALARFEEFAFQDALLFRLRYFLGCTFAEAAEICDIPETTAKDAWQRTRAWLQRELKGYRHDA
jgi:RNA polymerase sigma factor (TIGR02999 family)